MTLSRRAVPSGWRVAGPTAHRALPGILVLLIVSHAMAPARCAADDAWERIQKADNEVDAFQITWRLSTLHGSYSKANPARWEASGPTTQGRSIYVGDKTSLYRSDASIPAPGAGAVSNKSAYYTNGDLSLVVAGASPTAPPSGKVTRISDDSIEHSVDYMGQVLFLSQAPISRYFSPADILNTGVPGGQLRLEKHVTHGGCTYLVRMSVSPDSMRPLDMDILTGRYNRAFRRLEASGFRRSLSGVTYPTQVKVISSDTSIGMTPNNGSIATYTCEQARFKSDADVSVLRHVVPANTTLTDLRFGTEVTYTAMGPELASDDVVRRLVQQQEARNPTGAGHSNDVRRRLTRATALFACVIGAVLLFYKMQWRRAKAA